MDKRKEANERVKKQIRDAFFDLLRKQEFSAITVTDIVTRAGVARASYYRNFGTMEDIVREYFAFLRHEIERELNGAVIALGKHTPRECVTVPLAVYWREKDTILLLYDKGFGSFLQEESNRRAEEGLGDMPFDSVDRYRIYFISGATLNVLIQWLRSGPKETIDETADLLLKLIDQVL